MRKLTARFGGVPSNVGWLIGEQGLNVILSVFTIPIIVRYLGVENYGMITAYTAVLSIITPLASGGVDSVLSKNLVESPQEEPELLGNATIVMVMGCLVAFMLSLLYLCYRWVRSESLVDIQVGVAVMSVVFFRLQMVPTGYLQAKMLVKRASQGRIVGQSISHVGRLLCVFVKAPVAAFGWAATLGGGLFGLIVMLLQARATGMISPRKWQFDLKKAWVWRRSAFVLGFTGVMTMIYRSGDQLLVSHMLGDRELGLYGGVVRLAEFAGLLPVAINTALFPLLVKSRLFDRDIYENRILQLFRLQNCLTLIVSLVLTLAAGPVINLFYGDGFAAAAPLLCLYVWTCFFVAQINTKAQVLIAEGMYRVLFRWTIITAVLNIGINMILIPFMGISGAAIASLVSYGFLAFVATFLDPELRWVAKIQIKALVLPFPQFRGLV